LSSIVKGPPTGEELINLLVSTGGGNGTAEEASKKLDKDGAELDRKGISIMDPEA
jgi:hypothetical protein